MEAFKFQFLIIDTDHTFTDQNVYAWKFVNIGETNAILNNNFLLQAQQVVNSQNVWDEQLASGQKTSQGYKIKFQNKAGFKNSVQVIQKILVTNKNIG